MKKLGLLLVVIGFAGVIFGIVGIDRQTASIDLAGIKATATEHKTVPAAAIAGVICVIAGIAILGIPKR